MLSGSGERLMFGKFLRILFKLGKSKRARKLVAFQVERMLDKRTDDEDVVEEEVDSLTFNEFMNSERTSLGSFHMAFDGDWSWSIAKANDDSAGVFLKHDDKVKGPMRTSGQPLTATRIWVNFGEEIKLWSRHYQVPVELIIATIATETGGDKKARREEPGWISDKKTPHRVSVGLTQTLISSARAALNESAIDAKWLEIPSNAIKAGTAFIANQKKKTGFDPALVAAAYNAGGVYQNNGEDNKFKLRCYPIGTDHHVDRFCKFFGDAIHVLKEEG